MSEKNQIKLKCKKCNEILEADAQFCHGCGLRVAPTTCGCGAQLPEQVKFCTNCGNPTQPAFQQSEVVTEKNVIGWYLEVLKKYAVFTGRARRKEYWYFVLCNMIVAMILVFIGVFAGIDQILANIYNLGVLLPSIAVGVRRMQDTNRSGWWLFFPLLNLVYLTQDGVAGANKYGLDPKGGVSGDDAAAISPEQNKSSTKTVLISLAALLVIVIAGLVVFWQKKKEEVPAPSAPAVEAPKAPEAISESVTVENKYSVSLPSFLTKASNLNDDASLQYQNLVKEFYVIVIDEPKSVVNKVTKNGIKGYSELQLSALEQGVSVSQKSEIIDTLVNNMPARLVTINGRSNGVDAFWSLAFIQGKKRYYLIQAWTLSSNEYKYKDKMNQIMHSLKEL